jgi:diadenosine tetraphosphate (Ap4A) HIT family hydrolase
MPSALRWSCSRSITRTAACERDEKGIARAFEAHNNETCIGEGCYLNLLEQILVRHVHFHVEPREHDIILLSMSGK